MRHEEVMCSFFNFSAPTYYKRKREGTLAIKMIEKYFSKEELEEFIETGKIMKMEGLNTLYQHNNNLRNTYINIMSVNCSAYNMDEQSTIPFIFGLYVFLKKFANKFNNFHEAAISFSLSKYNILQKDDYEAIEAVQKRTIPILSKLDNIDGMYTYICFIVQENLKDLHLINSEEEEIKKEIKYQILNFEKIEKIIKLKLEAIEIQNEIDEDEKEEKMRLHQLSK